MTLGLLEPLPIGKPKHYLGANTEFKADTILREITGYAATWDVDQVDDRILKGAFKKTLQERGPDPRNGRSKIKVLWQHSVPIGILVQAYEDEVGLFTRTRILKTSLGDDVLELVRNGAVDTMSIGFDVIQADRDASGIRLIKEIKLWEVSYVTFPANEKAEVLTVKQLEQHVDRATELVASAMRRSNVDSCSISIVRKTREMLDGGLSQNMVRKWLSLAERLEFKDKVYGEIKDGSNLAINQRTVYQMPDNNGRHEPPTVPSTAPLNDQAAYVDQTDLEHQENLRQGGDGDFDQDDWKAVNGKIPVGEDGVVKLKDPKDKPSTCPKCGKKLDSSDKYCPNCGRNTLKENEAIVSNLNSKASEHWVCLGTGALPVGPAKAWDSNAAALRLRKFCGGPDKDKMNWHKYAKYHMLSDSGNIESFTSHKMPFADIVNGKPMAMPGAISACKGALNGARNQVSGSSEGKAAAARLVAHYENKMGKDTPKKYLGGNEMGKGNTMKPGEDFVREDYPDVTCDGCGLANSPAYKYCNHCGTKAADMNDGDADDTKDFPANGHVGAQPLNEECTNCGGFVPAGSNNCPWCGTKVSGKLPVADSGQFAHTVGAQKGKMKACPKCKTMLPMDAKYCLKCGYAMKAGSFVPPGYANTPDSGVGNTNVGLFHSGVTGAPVSTAVNLPYSTVMLPPDILPAGLDPIQFHSVDGEDPDERDARYEQYLETGQFGKVTPIDKLPTTGTGHMQPDKGPIPVDSLTAVGTPQVVPPYALPPTAKSMQAIMLKNVQNALNMLSWSLPDILKSNILHDETKAGKIFSRRNVDKIEKIKSDLQALLDGAKEDPMAMGGPGYQGGSHTDVPGTPSNAPKYEPSSASKGNKEPHDDGDPDDSQSLKNFAEEFARELKNL